eukprot:gene7325-biopygen12041
MRGSGATYAREGGGCKRARRRAVIRWTRPPASAVDRARCRGTYTLRETCLPPSSAGNEWTTLRYRDTPSSNPGARLAQTPDQTTARFLRPQMQHFGRGTTVLEFSAFAPLIGPYRAHDPGAQIIRMGSGRSPAFQQVSRDSIYAILSVRLAGFQSQLENGTDFVTGKEQHHTIAGAMMWCGNTQRTKGMVTQCGTYNLGIQHTTANSNRRRMWFGDPSVLSDLLLWPRTCLPPPPGVPGTRSDPSRRCAALPLGEEARDGCGAGHDAGARSQPCEFALLWIRRGFGRDATTKAPSYPEQGKF